MTAEDARRSDRHGSSTSWSDRAATRASTCGWPDGADTARDRAARPALAPPAGRVNGIDFIEILDPAQTACASTSSSRRPTSSRCAPPSRRRRSPAASTIPTVAVPTRASTWGTDGAGRPCVDVTSTRPATSRTYTCALADRRARSSIPSYDHVRSRSRRAVRRRSTASRRRPRAAPADRTRPPIDYLAKDFDSFRRALLEFSALRYPAWQERSEADFGVMFLEVLASVADDLSYQQDRIAAEAWLETATERRSLVRLARLVDYEPRVRDRGRDLLQFRMDGQRHDPCRGRGERRSRRTASVVEFETGTGLADEARYAGSRRRGTTMPAYWFDDGGAASRPAPPSCTSCDPPCALRGTGQPAGRRGAGIIGRAAPSRSWCSSSRTRSTRSTRSSVRSRRMR